MAVTPGGVGVRRADGIAVACLAVDLLALMTIDGIIADEGDGSVRDKACDDEACQQAGQPKTGPRGGGEESLIGGLVSLGQGSECAEKIGDGSSSAGE